MAGLNCLSVTTSVCVWGGGTYTDVCHGFFIDNKCHREYIHAADPIRDLTEQNTAVLCWYCQLNLKRRLSLLLYLFTNKRSMCRNYASCLDCLVLRAYHLDESIHQARPMLRSVSCNRCCQCTAFFHVTYCYCKTIERQKRCSLFLLLFCLPILSSPPVSSGKNAAEKTTLLIQAEDEIKRKRFFGGQH